LKLLTRIHDFFIFHRSILQDFSRSPTVIIPNYNQANQHKKTRKPLLVAGFLDFKGSPYTIKWCEGRSHSFLNILFKYLIYLFYKYMIKSTKGIVPAIVPTFKGATNLNQP